MQRVVRSLRKERTDRVGNEVMYCEAGTAEVEAAESTRYHKPKPPPGKAGTEMEKGRKEEEEGGKS